MRLVTIAIGLFGLLAAATAIPATAACPPGTVSPGNAEVDQYQETIPGTCGNQTPGDHTGGGGGSGGSSALPSDTAADLENLGPDGVAAAALAAAGAPRAAGRDDGRSGPGSGNGSGESGAASGETGDGGSSLAAVTDAITGDSDGGIGVLLPVILAIILIFALIGYRIRRSV